MFRVLISLLEVLRDLIHHLHPVRNLQVNLRRMEVEVIPNDLLDKNLVFLLKY